MLTNSIAPRNFAASLLSTSSVVFNTLHRLAAGLALLLVVGAAFTPARAETSQKGISADELRPFLGTFYYEAKEPGQELYISSIEVKQKGSGAEVKVDLEHWVANQSHNHWSATASAVNLIAGELLCSFNEAGGGAIQLTPSDGQVIYVTETRDAMRPLHNQLNAGTYESHDAAWAKNAKKNHPYVEGGLMKTMEVMAMVGYGMGAAGPVYNAQNTVAMQQAAAAQQAQIQAQ
jgi:hypothetical protein